MFQLEAESIGYETEEWFLNCLNSSNLDLISFEFDSEKDFNHKT